MEVRIFSRSSPRDRGSLEHKFILYAQQFVAICAKKKPLKFLQNLPQFVRVSVTLAQAKLHVLSWVIKILVANSQYKQFSPLEKDPLFGTSNGRVWKCVGKVRSF